MPAPSYRLYLFDWNGTLQDDAYTCYLASAARIFAMYGLPTPNFADYQRECQHDWLAYYRDRGLPRHVTGEMLNRIFDEGLSRLPCPRTFADALPTVRALRAAGALCSVVSGHLWPRLLDDIGRNGFVGLFESVEGEVACKSRSFLRIMAETGVAPSATVAIGDIVDDAEAALVAGIRAFICPRGFQSREVIEAAQPRLPNMTIVDSLDDVLKF